MVTHGKYKNTSKNTLCGVEVEGCSVCQAFYKKTQPKNSLVHTPVTDCKDCDAPQEHHAFDLVLISTTIYVAYVNCLECIDALRGMVQICDPLVGSVERDKKDE